ncbi:hypothetical protein [Spirosoma fluminis]
MADGANLDRDELVDLLGNVSAWLGDSQNPGYVARRNKVYRNIQCVFM